MMDLDLRSISLEIENSLKLTRDSVGVNELEADLKKKIAGG